MKQSSKKSDPEKAKHMWDEADIGSGEKSPGQQDTEEIIRQIPPLPDDNSFGDGGNINDESFDAAVITRIEQEQSLDKDEPSSELDHLDPVPPKGY